MSYAGGRESCGMGHVAVNDHTEIDTMSSFYENKRKFSAGCEYNRIERCL